MSSVLSHAAERLWAKKTRTGDMLWLPLAMHMEDAAALSKWIWHRWLPDGMARVIAEHCGCDECAAAKLLTFLAAAHDLGKALPVFQAKQSNFSASDLDEEIMDSLMDAGLMMQEYTAFRVPGSSLHALAGQIILTDVGCGRNIAAIVGAHHGRPAGYYDLMDGRESLQIQNFCVLPNGKPAWDAVRTELTRYALTLAGYVSFDEMPTPDTTAQMLLTGLVIMTDWIASNEQFFPYISIDDAVTTGIGTARVRNAADGLGFLKTVWRPQGWLNTDSYFIERFGFSPRPLQKAVLDTAKGIVTPGIFVLEAPTGIGKTEPALATAEIFAEITGRAGVFFALPTQATSDGIFPRLLAWVSGISDGLHSVELVHAKAQFNKDIQALSHIGNGSGISDEETEGAVVYSWFAGQKKALLADFSVGTVDQLLQMALRQKHVMLRHLALGNKVVIIDECHAYDAYMNVYLRRALHWLGCYRVPVILLSATLPHAKREELIAAYLGKERIKKGAASDDRAVDASAYPLITYTDGVRVLYRPVAAGTTPVCVNVERITDEEIVDVLTERLSGGGCAGVVVNTVQRAQRIAAQLQQRFPDDTVRLLHSRFLTTERMQRERALCRELGRPADGNVRPFLRIVVGTQVIEQSLDLDFDLLITDLCPMDLLLQRIGRLHRHERHRPERLQNACCLILGARDCALEPGSSAVYGEYLLMRTKALLPDSIALPTDVPSLVQNVYGSENALPYIPAGYDEAREKWELKLRLKERRAETFRLYPPADDPEDTIVGWLDAPVSDASGEAAVRDAEDALEVIALRRDKGGELYRISDGQKLVRSLPDGNTARRIACESLRLPPVLCVPGKIDAVIQELEEQSHREVPQWQKSPWLKGCLFLIFDETLCATLLKYRLQYDEVLGLICTKEVDMDG